MSSQRVPLVLLMALLVSGAAEAAAPLVFLHGIKGSTLVDKNGKRHWLTAVQALALSSPPLRLPARWDEGGRQPRDELTPGEILASVRLVPILVEIPIYGPWLKAAAASGRAFHPFAYDWRRELSENAEALERFVEKVQAEHDGAKVLAVAHSMGGLLLFSVVNRRPDLFAGAVFAGVPFEGGIGFLPDVQEGTSNGLNSRILAPEVVATFPSIYAFFPPGPSDRLRDETGKPETTDFTKVAEWKRQKLGLFAEGRTPPEGFETFLQEALVRARAFRATLAPRQKAYPPLAIVMANHLPTLAAGRRAGPKAKLGWDLTTDQEPGDGRVRASAMVLPGGVPHEVILTRKDHAGMLNDPAVQQRIFAMP